MINIIIGALIPLIGTTLGASCVFIMKKELNESINKGLTGFASGVMIAASVWSLIIPAIDMSSHLGNLAFFPAVIGLIIGIGFMFILDRIIPHLHYSNDEPEGYNHNKMRKTTMLVLAVVLHNIPEGMAVGAVFAGLIAQNSLITLAGALALNPNNKILLIDGDPQCNLTNDIGIDSSDMERNNIRTIFENKKIDPTELIISGVLEELPNIDIIPSNILLLKTEMQLISIAGREKLLANYIEKNKEFFSQYTHIIFDTNPNMGVVNQNIFYFVDSIILISDVSLNAIQGAELFSFLWSESIEDLGIENNIKALVINNFDKRINLAKDLRDYYLDDEEFRDILIDTPIPGSVAMKDTSLNHMPIVVLQPQHQAASAIKKVVNELTKREVF